ncbi:endonuclease/exonuclease/phosphatase family protein [Clostridium botulinum]|uniref:endonuclease/exonuclease/phosphatase family protein n=1 Tax=Clostridium TaxID=1485 RepID=UPI0005F8D114|nr:MULTISPECIES: endonuclease/exonuclease/phosphatase family protein [Clostridium]EJE7235108.1 endonuclease/exonuclease/phosphatase family protein [Clostridium botulinum]EKO1911560.1 endonuclease/exonuclease/phosphatase family protein [Clostridium botulinum]EKO2041621.1 endonuclease/exonuclease/phosphatase family protein [Clostridium botulinum]MBO0523992.1 endonuclease [Clostridium botulinum]MBO0528945.1 endonuclease [Clostridium botulinum]
MKVLTLNCHSWQEEKQLEKIRYLAKVIYENNYDVIALQEVSQSINSKILFDNIKEDNFALILIKELEELGENRFKILWDFAHIGYDKYEEGLAILTKHPIKEKDSFYISKSKDRNFWKTRKIIKCKIYYNNHLISLYSCHLGWWNDEEEDFKLQVNKLVQDVKEDETCIAMGDFNNDAFFRNEGYDYVIDKNLKDIYDLAKSKDNGVTVIGNIDGWENNRKNMRLDLILSNKNLDIEYCRVIFNGINKEIISDHFGVEAEIEI